MHGFMIMGSCNYILRRSIWKFGGFGRVQSGILTADVFSGTGCRSCTGSGSDTTSQDSLAWEALVDYSRLSPLEKKIHERHRDAVKQGKLFYVDPVTGYQVMTRLAHTDRGECCGNVCRHCPYAQKNVPEDKRTKTFNSAFYA